jgi:hypothetical protein
MKQPEVEPEMEELEREETKRMLQEDQGIVERETPATAEEKKKHPTLEPTQEPRKPSRWKEHIDKLKGLMKGWPKSEKETVPTPEKPKPPAPKEPEPDELPEPLKKEHPSKPHIDKGLPYVPKWRKWVNKVKDRVKGWGGKPKASSRLDKLKARTGMTDADLDELVAEQEHESRIE